MINFRALLSTILDVMFPAKQKRGWRWETRSAGEFEAAAAKATQDSVLAAADAIALFSYSDPLVREALHALKYQGERALGALFGELIAEHLKEEMSGYELLADALPLLIPIPVTFSRHIERSYNQTELIAQAAAKRLPGRVLYAPDVLVRTEFHGSQTLASTRRDRSGNVRGAFSVKDPKKIAGRDILLLDDVITTGATVGEAAATLLSCGAQSVSCIAVAH